MAEVKTHSFAGKPKQKSGDISVLKILSEKMVKELEDLIEIQAGATVGVEAKEARFTTYGQWSQNLPGLTSLSVFQSLPIKGGMILRLEEAMIASLMSVYFGGKLTAASRRIKPAFQSSECHYLARLSYNIVAGFVAAYSDYAVLAPVILKHETNPYHGNICSTNEQILCQPFTITAGDKIQWTVEFVYSADAASSIIDIIESREAIKTKADDPLWQRQWLKNIKQVHLPLRTILAQPVMTMPQLFDLKVGDVIPITPRSRPPLFIANHKFATGTMGEQDGCAAFKIETIQKGDPL